MDRTDVENEKFVAAQMGIDPATVDAHNEDPLKLKSDGNITRQILAMIGHDTLESVYGVYHDDMSIEGGREEENNLTEGGGLQNCHRTGGKGKNNSGGSTGKNEGGRASGKSGCCCEEEAQGADYQADSLTYSDGENDGE